MNNKRKATEESGERHQVLFGRGMRQEVVQLEGLSLLL
jgi:hypothetical protein